MMKPLAWILVALMPLTAFVACDRSVPEEDPRPNVVLVIIDALRADFLGSYGFPHATSTELDELAKDGVLFEHVIAQSSWTRPSIGSMLTSLPPRTIGIYEEQWDILQDEHLTLAEALRNRGYHTLGITANPNINSHFNFDQGFDEYVDSTMVFEWMAEEEMDEAEAIAASLRSQEILDLVLERAKDREAPTYVQLNLMEVHTPKLLRKEYLNRSGDTYLENYADAIAQISHDLDAFVRDLTALPGWKDNTIFVFTSDHGEGLGTHGEVVDSYFHGNVLYKAQVHVPLIFLLPPAGPGAAGAQPTGLRVPDRVRLLDVMPTLLDLVNIDPPPTLAGTSLRPFLEGRPNEVELPSIFFVESSWHDVDKVGAFAADWMYFEHRDDWGGTDPRELQAYDVPARGTATNRLYDHPEAATTLAEALARYLAAHPTEPAEQPDADSDPALLRQLRAVGYGD